MLDGPATAHREAIVIGVSAGAIDALMTILPPLPSNLRTPIVVVVHVPAARPSLLVEIFQSKCALPVAEPMDKQPLKPGIWFAPAGYHLLIEGERTFSLSLDDPMNGSRPAIDALFESAAECFGAGLLGVVLTGASTDGASGTRAIVAHGGLVIAQTPSTAQVSTMPAAAVDAGAISATLDDVRRILMMAGGT
jgi:two-component system chemotaxis response regulator CheB